VPDFETTKGGGFDVYHEAPPKGVSESLAKYEPLSPMVAESVEFNAFAPSDVLPKDIFIIDIWAHFRSDYPEVCKRAHELSREANLGRKSSVAIARGSRLLISLFLEDMIVSDNTDTIEWNGEPANASFAISVPDDCRPGEHVGHAKISLEGILIAKLVFEIHVGPKETSKIADRSVSLEFPRTAFASYASSDRLDVLKRVQGVLALRPNLDIFMDVLTLRAGQMWKEQLREHVPAKDIFLLFWSPEAARSKWVDFEWRLALEERGLDYIHPVPIAGPERAPPPAELLELHFSDPTLPVIEALQGSHSQGQAPIYSHGA
jgi:hypothetical protein